jgi:integrase
VPPLVTAEEVERVIAAADRSTPRGRSAFAILLLLARLGRVGAHIFRHGLATQMIRRGASLAEISQVLRHRSINTTQL